MKNFFKYGSMAVAGFVAIGVGIFAVNIITQPMRTVTGVMSKTFSAENVLTKYEWFHDANGQYMSRVNQIKVSKSNMKDETDTTERQRIRIELNAQQQSCRDLVTRYNANSTKINVGIFQGREAPATLDIATCE